MRNLATCFSFWIRLYIYFLLLIRKNSVPPFFTHIDNERGNELAENTTLAYIYALIFFYGGVKYQDIPLDNPGALLTEAQLAVESLRARFPTEEVDEGLHLILTTTTLENGVTVATAFGRIHGLGGEDGVEHVGAIDLGASVAS